MLGILLIANLGKGILVVEPDQLGLKLMPGVTLAEVAARYPDITIVDETHNIVQLPTGTRKDFWARFDRDCSQYYPACYIDRSLSVPKAPTFSFSAYSEAVGEQLKGLFQGEYGAVIYNTGRKGQREVPITETLGMMVGRSLSYLIPGTVLGIALGYLLALCAVWRPWLGRGIDKLHGLLLGLPDFFIIVIIQMLAIQLAKQSGHKVINIMQFGSEVPLLIPMVAISILPALLVYGTVRIAVKREWEEGYIKTAYSKGLSRTRVFFRHILRNTSEDLLTILPRTITAAITALVVAEVMTGTFGLGGYTSNPSIAQVTSLPVTCAILACFALASNALFLLLRKLIVVNTKEGA
ncbi:ABC-type dipeptide/oligopeptide/nickel transport system permease component [Tumebacillus sp. BK434]|uniref:ABC transporter permease subunit n=1 Tax=Tumebacillus sp. BK434 TaxID=2512169 RepID=UPI0010EE09EA|nr:ABC transporter permease subunit [Tumebacillus sp. BK434]TCP59655.1 ABC-type dipeptide/oligopeptide/nickel transport system permease component [Tumebacillus sp. BK434]